MRIAFVGKMGSGKTTAANFLVEARDFTRVSLATPVKQIATIRDREPDVNKWSAYLLDWARELLPDPLYAEDGYYAGGSAHSYLVVNWKKLLLEVEDSRELLQKIGTDVGRKVKPTIWIDHFCRNLADANLVMDDVRFLNESKAMGRLGFKIVKLNIGERYRKNRLLERDGFYAPELQGHASEVELDLIVPDFVIDNSYGPEHLFGGINEVLTGTRMVA